MDFVHLHAKTHYSFLDGTMSPKELVNRAKSQGFSTIAITDSGNMCGMLEAYNAGKEAAIKVIYGIELWIGERRRKEKSLPVQMGLFGSRDDEGEEGDLSPAYMVVLLIEDESGYTNICQILSLAHEQMHYAPVISIDQLEPRGRGIHCIIPQRFGPIHLSRNPIASIGRLEAIFGEKISIEIFDDGSGAEEAIAKGKETSSKTGIPLLVTNPCHYATPEDAPLLSTMRAIKSGYRPLDESSPIHLGTDQLYLKSAEEMLDLFPDMPHAIARSAQIAESCTFTPDVGHVYLPNTTPPGDLEQDRQWEWLLGAFPPPSVFGDVTSRPDVEPGWTLTETYFAWFCRTGLHIRLQEEPYCEQFGSPREYRERLEMEISVIRDMGFTAYHLIVMEFINWAKDNGVAVGPGRGSAAGAVVCWAMRITDVNPLQFNLMFERYLNTERISMPDIDVDFAQDGRERVIDHVRQKYGEDCVCQILTIGTMKAKGALKDCARSLNIHFTEADQWSKHIAEGPKTKLKEAIAESPYLTALKADPKFGRALELALRLEGKPRQTGIHAAGVIITSDPIANLIPMHTTPDEKTGERHATTGMEMGASEKMGLVKFDFLGLKTLDIIEAALDSIEQRELQRPSPIQPDFADKGVFELLQRGDSLGLFQVESDGMRRLLISMVPDHMEDIVAISALYRPGPLGSGMVTQYVEVKHGREKPQYPHPLLEEVLGPTHGVFVYQEQVMAAARVLAGFTLGEADLLRRAMGKKKQEEMDKQRAKFTSGCRSANNIPEDESSKIFDLIDHFAGYGFNKCLSGKTLVLRAGANGECSPEVSLEELYNAQQSKTPWGKKIRGGRLHIAQMHPDGRVRTGQLKKVHYTGKKETFQITTSGGKKIFATKDHRLLTPNGYRKICEMKAMETHVICMSDVEVRQKKGYSYHAKGKTYSESNPGKKGVPNGNENPGWIDGRTVFFECAKEQVQRRSPEKCEKCNTSFENPGPHDLEFAHILSLEDCDGDYSSYHNETNILMLCNSCHKKFDYRKGERKKRWTKGRATHAELVVSIVSNGLEDTFDVEMKDPYHNFIANDIVSHNSHSASYGVITYATAWLKAHYRADLMAAAMTLEASNREKLKGYVNDCKRASIPILLPSINKSKARFSVERNPEDRTRFAIRYGIGAIKGIGDSALDKILKEREKEPFASLSDLIRRASPNKTVLKALACSGALDEFFESRFMAWKSVSEEPSGEDLQGSLIEEGEAETGQAKARAWILDDKLEQEEQTLGCWLSGHPLDRFRDVEEKLTAHSLGEIPDLPAKHSVTIVGAIVKIEKRKTKRGDPLMLFSISDRSGSSDFVIPELIYQSIRRRISKGTCIQIRATKEGEGPEGRVRVHSVELLIDMRKKMTKVLHLHLSKSDLGDNTLSKLKRALSSHVSNDKMDFSAPRLRMIVHLSKEISANVTLPRDPSFEISQDLFDEIERILGRPDALRSP